MPLAELFGLVALRLAYPDVVVDLNRAAGLHGVRDEGDHLVIGAMTTHYEVIRSELVRRHCGLLALEPAEVLVSAVAMPVLKRFGPVLGGLAFGLVLGLLLGHRRRIVIMTAAAPGSYPPARTVL
jgi:CO/xanthine dehydrogenase FAD-binding subunit